MADEKIARQSSISQEQQSSSHAKRSSRRAGKSNKSQVGGTAVPGAKSTQPKQMPTSNDPNQQQMASYNRDMRRRMQHLGTGPYGASQATETLQEKRKKRLERRKQRLEERRQELMKTMPKGSSSLGRRNMYFLAGTAILIALIIVAFIVLRMYHIIG